MRKEVRLVFVPCELKELEVGMLVLDEENTLGKIKECYDLHNVLIEYVNEGIGFTCVVDDCSEDGDAYVRPVKQYLICNDKREVGDLLYFDGYKFPEKSKSSLAEKQISKPSVSICKHKIYTIATNMYKVIATPEQIGFFSFQHDSDGFLIMPLPINVIKHVIEENNGKCWISIDDKGNPELRENKTILYLTDK